MALLWLSLHPPLLLLPLPPHLHHRHSFPSPFVILCLSSIGNTRASLAELGTIPNKQASSESGGRAKRRRRRRWDVKERKGLWAGCFIHELSPLAYFSWFFSFFMVSSLPISLPPSFALCFLVCLVLASLLSYFSLGLPLPRLPDCFFHVFSLFVCYLYSITLSGLPLTRLPDGSFHVLSPFVCYFYSTIDDRSCFAVLEIILHQSKQRKERKRG